MPDASDPAPNYSAKLNPDGGGAAVGPTLMIPVSAGDVVNMETWARYNITTGGVNSLVSNLAALVSSAFVGVSGVSEANRITLGNAVPGVSGNIPNGGGNNEPKAYLNYILLENSYVQNQYGLVSVSTDGYQAFEKLSTGDLTMPVSGYLYIYEANESIANVDVWFDDLRIIHIKANNTLQVVGAKDYYPFGLPIAGTEYWNEGRKSYKYGYQGVFSEQQEETKWNTFALRSYDPALGRIISSDPAGQFASPYLGMANNPANYTDPSGAVAGAIAHSIFGAAMAGAHKEHQNEEKIFFSAQLQ
ncbi:MAG: RHS repeat-associated core domain-containing protein [Cyclobacteriaceae bacterium]